MASFGEYSLSWWISWTTKKGKNSYSEIGKAKCEWADKIGEKLILEENQSPSFRFFINELQSKIEAI